MNAQEPKTPITDKLRDRLGIARLGCSDLFVQLEKFELRIIELEKQLQCLTQSSAR